MKGDHYGNISRCVLDMALNITVADTLIIVLMNKNVRITHGWSYVQQRRPSSMNANLHCVVVARLHEKCLTIPNLRNLS